MSRLAPPPDGGLVHRGAHPSLPPAAPQQVVQYLLAKNYHLTALELLVEAQASGHGEDVRDLQAFFSDPERFPPEELARQQPADALELQAAARERESRLQMAEYELRLAKEDLAEMARKLAAAQEGAPGPGAGAPGATAGAVERSAASAPAGSIPLPELPAPARPAPAPEPPAPAAAAPPQLPSPGQGSSLGGGPGPSDVRALNAAVFAHLLRQGLVTTAMTMEEEVGGPLRAATPSHAGSVGGAPGAASGPGEQPWELWAWYHAAAAAAAAASDHTGTRAGSLAYTSSRKGSLAFGGGGGGGGGGGEEVVAAAVAAVAATGVTSNGRPGSDSGASSPDLSELGQELGLDLDLGFDLGSEDDDLDVPLEESATDGEASGTDGGDGAAAAAEVTAAEKLRSALATSRRQMQILRTRATAAVAAAASAAAAAKHRAEAQAAAAVAAAAAAAGSGDQPTHLRTAGGSLLDDLLAEGTSGPSRGPAPPSSGPTASGAAEPPSPSREGFSLPPLHPAASPSVLDGSAPSASTSPASAGPSLGMGGAARPLWCRLSEEQVTLRLALDPSHVAALEALLGALAEALPRLVPNLNIKTRVEALPLLLATARTTSDWEVRRQLLVAAFNLAPAPDAQQRQAIIEACLELCRSFGSGWAATEFVGLCCKHAASASAERRMLVAEALGAAVGTVDPGTQAHVLLTQLSQLARDRMETVREAACHSLARLVPRLPYSRSYYTPLEALLMALAADASEAVHTAALSYLVPALLTWQPQDADTVLVSSCLSRVLSDLSQHVTSIAGHAQYKQAAAAAAAAAAATDTASGSAAATAAAASAAAASAAHGGTGFAGSVLRYGHTSTSISGTSPLATTNSAGSAGVGGGGSTTDLTVAPRGVSYSGGAGDGGGGGVAVLFGRRAFPSAAHLAAYQLLGLYCALAPALRQAAVRSRPAWAAPPGSAPASASHRSSASASRHHRTGSTGAALGSETGAATPSTPAPAAAATTAGGAAVPHATRTGSGTLSPGHRRTASHPLPHAGGAGSAGAPGASHPSHRHGASTIVGAAAAAAAAAAAGVATAGALESPTGGSPQPQAQAQGQGQAGEEGREGEVDADDASMGLWAGSAAHSAWKTLEWVVQLVVPELLRLVLALGAAGHEAAELRRQAAAAVGATCTALGPSFTRTALLPIFAAAGGCGASLVPSSSAGPAGAAGSSGGGAGPAGAAAGSVVVSFSDRGSAPLPPALVDAVAGAQPRTAEALRLARLAVLPVLLGSVLPTARMLRPYLGGLMGTAHEMRHRWLLEALPEYTAALTTAATLRPDLIPDLLLLLEDLLSGKHQPPTAATDQPPTGQPSHGTSGSPAQQRGDSAADADGSGASSGGGGSAGPASTAAGLCCVAVARSLVPLSSLELASRRLLPAIMALLSYGDPELQRACVGVLAELGLRFRNEGPRVSEQVLVVFDSLLEQGSHAVQLEVLAAGTALAAAAAPSAAVSAAAASQVEWLLMAVQVVALRLQHAAAAASGNLTVTPGSSAAAAGGAGGSAAAAAASVAALGPEQQRALAAALLAALKAVAPHDLRLPRLQATLGAALDSLGRCKALLPDPQQQAALAALQKERSAAGQAAAAGASVSSAPAASAAPAAAPSASPAASSGAANSTPNRPHAASATGAGAGGASTPVGTAAGAGFAHDGGSAAATPPPAEAPGALRSRFDAFKQRLMKKKDEPGPGGLAAAGAGGAHGLGAGGGQAAFASIAPKECFFSDDEGDA
ncbi:hypothetical protein HYH03_004387 [Edaphochlamys debaryana]|uniref:LisH domain-containing protein n=1 Tax=Edaphochlamys debaryana TaxID=47281 RepID=A0A835YAB7_9CHLO|nr:hypothetical protein HYH03_004387 [Edaphochlamys debaryana]|eukprot:KAG2497648.1 hypothetical protein HYH03_004387 [Edaphochlamys debaryana]